MAKEQDCHTSARLLPTSLAFYCWALHARMRISRKGAGSLAYAPGQNERVCPIPFHSSVGVHKSGDATGCRQALVDWCKISSNMDTAVRPNPLDVVTHAKEPVLWYLLPRYLYVP